MKPLLPRRVFMGCLHHMVHTRIFVVFACLSVLSGCLHVKMDVHAVVDVNVKMEQAVTNLLADIYGDSKTVNTDQLPAAPAPAPATK